jgi:hypothetical protein
VDWPANHFFYVIAPRSHYLSKSGAVKIGITSNPNARILQLQTGHPERLLLVHSFGFPDRWQASSIERAVMEVAADHRLSGEWFDIPWTRAVLIGAVNSVTRFAEQKHVSFEDMVAAEPTAKIIEGFEKSGHSDAEGFAWSCFYADRDDIIGDFEA